MKRDVKMHKKEDSERKDTLTDNEEVKEKIKPNNKLDRIKKYGKKIAKILIAVWVSIFTLVFLANMILLRIITEIREGVKTESTQQSILNSANVKSAFLFSAELANIYTAFTLIAMIVSYPLAHIITEVVFKYSGKRRNK